MSDPQSVGTQVVKLAARRVQELARQTANRIGTPLDGNRPNQDQLVRLWNMRNPQANPMQVQQLIDAGQHAQALDMVFPWRNKLIGTGTPNDRVARAQHLSDLSQRREANTDLQSSDGGGNA